VRHFLRPYHPCSLYLRTFGSTNHEVKTTADGQLETIRPIEGRFYRFNLVLTDGNTGPGQLVITELDPTQPDCGLLELQLLDTGAGDSCAGWGDQLPVRLREMHSHWYCRCVCGGVHPAAICGPNRGCACVVAHTPCGIIPSLSDGKGCDSQHATCQHAPILLIRHAAPVLRELSPHW
jgi:hypothetical protein